MEDTTEVGSDVVCLVARTHVRCAGDLDIGKDELAFCRAEGLDVQDDELDEFLNVG